MVDHKRNALVIFLMMLLENLNILHFSVLDISFWARSLL